jgi:hypothetical protein
VGSIRIAAWRASFDWWPTFCHRQNWIYMRVYIYIWKYYCATVRSSKSWIWYVSHVLHVVSRFSDCWTTMFHCQSQLPMVQVCMTVCCVSQTVGPGQFAPRALISCLQWSPWNFVPGCNFDLAHGKGTKCRTSWRGRMKVLKYPLLGQPSLVGQLVAKGSGENALLLWLSQSARVPKFNPHVSCCL